MICVLAFVTAQPEKRDLILQAFKENRPAVLAEDGCLAYEAVTDVRDYGPVQTAVGPDTFVVVERWMGVDAFRAHVKSPHMAEYGRMTAPWIKQRIIHVLEPSA